MRESDTGREEAVLTRHRGAVTRWPSAQGSLRHAGRDLARAIACSPGGGLRWAYDG